MADRDKNKYKKMEIMPSDVLTLIKRINNIVIK